MLKVQLPTWVRVLVGAAGFLLLLLGLGSAPQALRDTLLNVPFLSRSVPWGVLVAVAAVLLYVSFKTHGQHETGPRPEAGLVSTALPNPIASAVKEWYHARGDLASVTADRMLYKAHHVVPGLHKETIPAVTEFQRQLKSACQQLSGLQANEAPDVAVAALANWAHWYGLVVALSAEFASSGIARWRSEMAADYDAWLAAHTRVVESLPLLTATSPFDGRRTQINSSATTTPRFG